MHTYGAFYTIFHSKLLENVSQYGETEKKQFKRFHDLLVKIGEQSNEGLSLVMNTYKIRACTIGRKCIDNDICEKLKDNFKVRKHEDTRNAQSSRNIPIIKTEYALLLLNSTSDSAYTEQPLRISAIELKKEYFTVRCLINMGS